MAAIVIAATIIFWLGPQCVLSLAALGCWRGDREIAMLWFSLGIALLASLAIIGIGVGYLGYPRAMAPSFGLAVPASGSEVFQWLRLKGTRDIVTRVIVLAVMATASHRELGLVLLIAAFIPLGDMATVLAGGGRASTAFGVHGLTAALMIPAAIFLMNGAA